MMTGFDSWESELYHFGIKGQKWGRRRWQNEDGSLTPEGIRRYGTRENYERLTNRKKVKYMTDEELQKHNERLRAEREAKELSKPSIIRSAEKIADSLQKKSAEKHAYELKKEENRIRLLESQNSVKRAKEATKMAEANAKKTKSEASIYGTKAKTLEAKTDLKRAKSEHKKLGWLYNLRSIGMAKVNADNNDRSAKNNLERIKAETILQQYKNVSALAEAAGSEANAEAAKWGYAKAKASSQSSNPDKKKDKKK